MLYYIQHMSRFGRSCFRPDVALPPLWQRSLRAPFSAPRCWCTYLRYIAVACASALARLSVAIGVIHPACASTLTLKRVPILPIQEAYVHTNRRGTGGFLSCRE